MENYNKLKVSLGQEVFVTYQYVEYPYAPNVHKERVTSVHSNSFYTSSDFDSEYYTKRYDIFTGTCDVGKKHYKVYTSEEEYLESLIK